MTARALEKATYADLLRVPDTLLAELIYGELDTSSRSYEKAPAVRSERHRLRMASRYRCAQPGGHASRGRTLVSDRHVRRKRQGTRRALSRCRNRPHVDLGIPS